MSFSQAYSREGAGESSSSSGSTTEDPEGVVASDGASSSVVVPQKQRQLQAVDSNMSRNEEIMFNEREIAMLQTRLNELRRQWEHQYWTTALGRCDGTIAALAWNQLPGDKRYRKPYLLAVLRNPNCKRLPRRNLSSLYYWDGHPLEEDREILLARLGRDDFAEPYFLDDEPFRLPGCFWTDKEVVMATIRAYPQILEDSTDWVNFLDDPDVMRALFQAKDTSENRGDLMVYFSERLLSDSTLMLEALEHGVRVFHVIHRSLRNNRAFALQAAQVLSENCPHAYRHRRWLKPFSQRLKADPAVVKAFCKVNGQSLAVASYPLRRNREICEAACRSTPVALLHCLKSKARKELVNDKSFLLEIMQGSSISPGSEVGPRVWKLIPDELQADREVALAVIKKFEEVGIERMKASLKRDPSFILEVAAAGRLTSIPCHVTSKLCWDLLKLPALGSRVMKSIVKCLPNFYGNRRVWETIYPVQPYLVLENFLERLSDGLLHDKDIMMRFCGNEDGADLVLTTLDETMSMIDDQEFLERALQNSTTGLYCIPASTQHLFPDVIRHTIENAGPDSYDDLDEFIDDDLFENRDFLLTWLRQGWPLPDEEILLLYQFDEEIMLTVAEKYSDLFQEFAMEMMEDRAFVLKAVARNGQLWPSLDLVFKGDFEVGLAAFAAMSDLPFYCAREEFTNITLLARDVRAKLEVHELFVKLILGSIDCAGPECPLHLLNQGRDTTLVYKQIIAECLDVPCGAKLQQLQKASDNLALWGF